jgi:hypothetical protein
VLPAVVSIPTRQIERDQFDQSIVTPGLGSGIIVDRRGYVLTNDHVIQGVEQIKIALADERTFRAPGTDRPDLAGTVRRESEPAAGVRLRRSRGPGRADQAHRAGRARGPCGAGGRRRRHGGRRSAGNLHQLHEVSASGGSARRSPSRRRWRSIDESRGSAADRARAACTDCMNGKGTPRRRGDGDSRLAGG